MAVGVLGRLTASCGNDARQEPTISLLLYRFIGDDAVKIERI